jgi:hypothetical protein
MRKGQKKMANQDKSSESDFDSIPLYLAIVLPNSK